MGQQCSIAFARSSAEISFGMLVVQFDYLGETTEGNLHVVQRLQRAGVINIFGLNSLDAIYTADTEQLQVCECQLRGSGSKH